jgi:hypothetical protein
VVECFPGKLKALSSNLSTTKKLPDDIAGI